jgi:Tol biopolymer transport system component
MQKIAVYIIVATLLALGACDSVGQRSAVAAAAQVGAGIAFATVEPPQDTIPTVVRRVWGEADFLVSPSPDGRFVSLTDWTTGDVAVRDLETGEVRHVTHNPMPWVPGFALLPQTSPDGGQIAYSWWRNEQAEFELRIVDWDGSEPRTLLSNEQRILALAWAPDGRNILVIRRRRDASEQELALVAAADGSMTMLASTGTSSPRGAGFSPDGRFIAYDLPNEEDPDRRDIFVLNVDGRHPTRIVDDMSNDYLLGWAPAGGHILYCSDRTGTPGVWLLPVRDGRPEGQPELVLPDTWGVQPIGFVRGGKYYYGVETGAREIYVATLSADHGSVVAAPTLATPRRFGNSGYPAWSPDGRHLAYIRTQGVTGLSSLIIRSPETGEVRELALGEGLRPIAALRWMPDGRSFVLMAGNDTGVTGIYRVDVQTGRPEVLVSGRAWDTGDGLDLSPDGRFLYYRGKVEGEDKYDERVFKRDLRSGSTQEIYRAPVGTVRNVAVSPDGSNLALSLQALDEMKHQIVVLPAAGGEARALTPPTNGIFSIAWTPEGEAILYSMYKSHLDASEQKTNLWRVAVAGGEPELVGLELEAIRYPRFHPDGRRIVFAAGGASFELWVMENFLPGTR